MNRFIDNDEFDILDLRSDLQFSEFDDLFDSTDTEDKGCEYSSKFQAISDAK